MRICATKEKIGCSGVKTFTQHEKRMFQNLQKITITKAIPRNFCELGKRIREYVNKLTEIA
jgi:hypothetical protein